MHVKDCILFLIGFVMFPTPYILHSLQETKEGFYFACVVAMLSLSLMVAFILIHVWYPDENPKFDAKEMFRRIDARLERVQPCSYFVMEDVVIPYNSLSVSQRNKMDNKCVKRHIRYFWGDDGTTIVYFGEGDKTIDSVIEHIHFLSLAVSHIDQLWISFEFVIDIPYKYRQKLLKHDIFITEVNIVGERTTIDFTRV